MLFHNRIVLKEGRYGEGILVLHVLNNTDLDFGLLSVIFNHKENADHFV